MNRRHVKGIAWGVAGVLTFFALLLAYAVYIQLTHDKVDPITTSIAVPTPSTTREVNNIVTNSDGELVITYSDGSKQNAGRVKGDNGADGQVPSEAQLSAAVYEYCQNGRCDAKNPTEGQILQAISKYCAGGSCKGVDAKPVTAQQISLAVSNYCANDRCKGVKGDIGIAGVNGANGTNGKNADTTVIDCVIRSSSTLTTRYVAWKYSLEAKTAYRDIYKLPSWAECTNPIDLRS